MVEGIARHADAPSLQHGVHDRRIHSTPTRGDYEKRQGYRPTGRFHSGPTSNKPDIHQPDVPRPDVRMAGRVLGAMPKTKAAEFAQRTPRLG
jgi:hypothetical protein